MNVSIVDVLIENIKTDQNLLVETEIKVEEAKEKKKAIVERLKDYRKEIAVIVKYASDDQKEKIEALGFDSQDGTTVMNTVASVAFDLIVKAKEYKLTNKEWYDAYLASLKNKDEAVNYTAFNIKCRTLFNSQRLIRTKSGGVSSHEDIISLNGRPQTEKKSTSEAPQGQGDSKKESQEQASKPNEAKKATTTKDKKNATTSKQK